MLLRLDITSREPYAEGRTFGAFGPYELLRGVAHFAVDPQSPALSTITDITLAERDAASGLVAFDADVRLVRPVTAEHSRRLLFVVSNRGMVSSLPMSVGLPATLDPSADGIEPGDGFALQQGLTVAWCGWQWDVPRSPAMVGLRAPQAARNGRAVDGTMRVEFRSDMAIADHLLADATPLFRFTPYPAADVEQRDAVLTVRDWPDGPKRLIPRERWRFARASDDGPIPDDERVWLEGGFVAHQYYELIYRTRVCPVVGTGLLSVRDFVSFLRYDPSAANPCAGSIDTSIGFGISQSGRFLREFLHSACNVDESGRPVFDGVHAHIAGARRGEFNQRYGQPSLTYVASFGHLPPFAGDLLDRQRTAGCVPKVVLTNTSFEYWRSDAALAHIDATNGTDLPDPPEIRTYLFAGIDHIGDATVFKSLMPVANVANPLGATLLLRAAFANLERWACDGDEPPESRVPRVANGTAVAREKVLARMREVAPGLIPPDAHTLATTRPLDLGPDVHLGIGRWPAIPGHPLPAWVPEVDADGNEIAGVRLPALQAPVGTFTGWNPRRPMDGLPLVPYEFVGSWLPFAASSVTKRYATRDAYVTAARVAADQLVGERLLLLVDAEMAVAAAVALYDGVVG